MFDKETILHVISAQINGHAQYPRVYPQLVQLFMFKLGFTEELN